MKPKTIKTGIMSYGMSGQLFHAPFIDYHEMFELTAILERSRNLSAERYPDATIVRSTDELLAINELELIIVNTPDLTHYEYTRQALLAGKHVVVEKPFAQTVAQCRELIRIAEERNLMLCVYQNRRWDGDFLTVKNIIEQGTLGRLVEFESTFARYRNYIKPDTWKEQSGGMMYNLGSHIVDQTISLFGLPEAVYVDIATMRDGGVVDDYFCLHLIRCAKNPELRVTLKAGYLMCEPEPRFVLHGTEGSYLKHGVDPQEERLKNGETPLADNWGLESPDKWGVITTEQEGRVKYPTVKGDYTSFYDAVYQSLRNGAEHPTDARGNVAVIQLLETVSKAKPGSVVDMNPK
ncbi:MAG: Gfo/Idh/MocA family oxidoreductase [Tannerella sp.]|jgi:predicted dehydrogenase|nr:Gfo/Idh/MocA family oxidoreductase [Tannerella sp.]